MKDFRFRCSESKGPGPGGGALSNWIHLREVERQSGDGDSNVRMKNMISTMGGEELEPDSNRMLDAMLDFGFRLNAEQL